MIVRQLGCCERNDELDTTVEDRVDSIVCFVSLRRQ